jgi:hypothetical protein
MKSENGPRTLDKRPFLPEVPVVFSGQIWARLVYALLNMTRRFGLDLENGANSGLVELRLGFHREGFASLSGTTRVRAT